MKPSEVKLQMDGQVQQGTEIKKNASVSVAVRSFNSFGVFSGFGGGRSVGGTRRVCCHNPWLP
jgi:hypothetical protein